MVIPGQYTDGWFWLSSERMTFGARVENQVVVEVAPIARVFIGQPMNNLVRWMQKQSGFRMYSYQTESWR